jgi:hypothetical protein
LVNGKHGKGTHCTKMGADKLAENTPNLSAQNVCPKPKVWDFDEKRLQITRNFLIVLSFNFCIQAI